MANKTARILAWVIGAAVVAAAVVASYVLLRGEGAAPSDPYDTQYARMHDPEYLKQLDVLREEQRRIGTRLVAAKEALDAAKSKGEDSPEYRAAVAEMDAATKDFNANRAKAQLAVRERIMRENDAIKVKQSASKKKGE